MTARKSTALKRLEGTYRKDRDRSKKAAGGKRAPVGPPPSHMTKSEGAIWRELSSQVQPNFTRSDRTAFELLVRLRAKLDDPGLPPHAFVSLAKSVASLLAAFGCVPAARSKVDPLGPPEAEEDEYSAGRGLDEFAVTSE